MGQPWPQFPSDVQGGDEATYSPAKGQSGLLAAEDGTQNTRRLVTDSQRRLKVIADVATNPSLSGNRSDVYMAPGIGVTIDGSSYVPESYLLQVKGTGAPATSWTVVLEGSPDNVNFTTLMTHVTGTGDGIALLSGANLYPALYFRSRVVALSLGSATNIIVTIIGKG